MKKTDINKDIIKRDGAERRKEDIAAHGKPTAFRKTMTKNKKAYTRKEKHKVRLSENDISYLVMECIKRIIKGER